MKVYLEVKMVTFAINKGQICILTFTKVLDIRDIKESEEFVPPVEGHIILPNRLLRFDAKRLFLTIFGKELTI